jgi:hypothetical protein
MIPQQQTIMNCANSRSLKLKIRGANSYYAEASSCLKEEAFTFHWKADSENHSYFIYVIEGGKY